MTLSNTRQMISRKMVSLAGLLLPLVFQTSAGAQEGFSEGRFLRDTAMPWEISADRVSYEQQGELVVAEGDVVIRRGDQRLRAGKAVYNHKTGVAAVSEGILLDADGDLLSGEEAVFDLQEETGRVTDGSLFLRDNHVYLKGRWIERELRDTYRIADCRLTTCDGDLPAWSITGSEVEVTVEGYGTVKHAAFRVKDYPVFYLPYLIFPAKTRRQTGLLPPVGGYSSRNGFEIELPFFWAISDTADATFYQHYLTSRGYMQGLELRYVLGEGSKGLALFDILSDDKEKDPNDVDDASVSPLPRTNQTRYWLRGRSDQELPFGLLARTDLDYVSDQDYLREFNRGLWGYKARPDLAQASGRPLDEDLSPLRKNAVRIGRETQALSLHATGSYWQKPEDIGQEEILQPLGGGHLRFFPVRVMGSPSFFLLESEYDYLWRETGDKGQRVALYPGLTFPLWPLRYLELEPSVSYAVVGKYIDGDQGNTEMKDTQAYEAGVRMSTNLERVFRKGLWGAEALKHRFRPTLRYDYQVLNHQDVQGPWFEPIEAQGKVNRVTLTLDNYLDARFAGEKGSAVYRQWGYFALSQGYNIDEARREENLETERTPFEPLTAVLSLSPGTRLDLYGTAAWNHNEGRLDSADLSSTLTLPRAGNRIDALSLTYHYLTETSEAVHVQVHLNLPYGFSTGGFMNKELRAGQEIASGLWIDYESQCWGVRLGAEKEDESTNVTLTVRLKGLGEITGL